MDSSKREVGVAKAGAPAGSDGARPISRRGLVAGATGAGVLLALGLVRFLPDEPVCRPPGAQDETRFLGACVRCGKCMEVCPNGVVVPSHLEDGIVNMRTPRLEFSRSSSHLQGMMGWCDHCNAHNGGVARCAEVCPSGALSPDEDSSFETMVLGKAAINKDWCLAWRLKGCTICVNACPLEAIYLDEHDRPVVDEELCNGCGKCEQVCVSMQSTSIGQGESYRSMTARAITVSPVGAEGGEDL